MESLNHSGEAMADDSLTREKPNHELSIAKATRETRNFREWISIDPIGQLRSLRAAA